MNRYVNKQPIIYLLGCLFIFISSCAIKPPYKKGDFRSPDLVELVKLDSTIRLDIRYATDNNFVDRPVYTQARAFLQRPAAEALISVHQKLKQQGFGILVFDGYRPWRVTKVFWEITPKDKKNFVANPRKGSMHNRGCAVDISLYDLSTGKEVEMTGQYDEMTERSFVSYPGGTESQRKNRDLLIATMEAEGFKVLKDEWWHFTYKDAELYNIADIPFEEIP